VVLMRANGNMSDWWFSGGHTAARRIILTERKPQEISAEDFQVLQRQPSFNSLIELKILSVVMRGRNRFELNPSHYLGAASLENSWVIEIIEKAAGTLRGLFEELSSARYKIPKASISSSADGAIFLHIANSFLDSVEIYLGRGRVKNYEVCSYPTSRPSGRIDFAKSIKHISRGDPSTICVSSFVLTPDIIQNRIIAYCLVVIEVFARHKSFMREVLVRARTLYLIFRDVKYAQYSRMSVSSRVDCITEAIRKERFGTELENTLELAFPIFVGGGLFGLDNADFQTSSMFIDMEYLFEVAILKRFNLSGAYAVRGKGCGVKIFPEISKYRCEPDVVLQNKERRPLAVGDVKYKTLEISGPSQSDVYQVLAHAEAFSVSTAFLVFPASEFSSKNYGRANNGVGLTVFTVRAEYLGEDVFSIMAELQLGSAST
jgi:5-methylcytosine-specific restriction endonuclease McrBC regulatory subunit McrC